MNPKQQAAANDAVIINNAQQDQLKADEACTDAIDDIVSQCVEAKDQGEPWEPILYDAAENAQTVDAVLGQLAGQDGFSGRVVPESFAAPLAMFTSGGVRDRCERSAGN